MSLRWPGGKSAFAGPVATGRWLLKHLPDQYPGYAEPFFGMGGVLLNRPKVFCEKVNDIEEGLVNWWRAIIFHCDELVGMMDRSPYWSEDLWKEAVASHDTETDPVKKAYWYTIRLEWSYMGMGTGLGRYNHTRRDQQYLTHKVGYRFVRLRDRMKGVQIHNEDAVSFMRRLVDRRGWCFYVDPPYADKSDGFYKHTEFDRDALAEVMEDQAGFVAVSGYDDEWDRLGWEKIEIDTVSGMSTLKEENKRTEMLWVNRTDDLRNRQGKLL